MHLTRLANTTLRMAEKVLITNIFHSKSNGIIIDPRINEKKDLIKMVIGIKQKLLNSFLYGGKILSIDHDSVTIKVKLTIEKGLHASTFTEVERLGTGISMDLSSLPQIDSNSYIATISVPLNSSIFKDLEPARFRGDIIVLILLAVLIITFSLLLKDHWKDYEDPWKDIVHLIKEASLKYISRS
jgi:hypothetical protein